MKPNLIPKKQYEYRYNFPNGSRPKSWRAGASKHTSYKELKEVIFDIVEKEWGPEYILYTYLEQPYFRTSYKVDPNALWYEIQLRKQNDKRKGFTIRYVVERNY